VEKNDFFTSRRRYLNNTILFNSCSKIREAQAQVNRGSATLKSPFSARAKTKDGRR
jgi:hypothetical protein